jgi:dolichol-phosphate mannosyltransferase
LPDNVRAFCFREESTAPMNHNTPVIDAPGSHLSVVNAAQPGAPSVGEPTRVRQPLISIVVPTRHEAGTIGAFLHRLAAALASTTYEILVVDDSDNDNTVDVLYGVQQELGDDRLIVVHRPRGSVADRTLGSAVVTGIRRARGTYVCVLDADGQHPPEVISQLIATAERTNAEYVGASRYVAGGNPQGLDGISRKAISRGLALTARAAFIGSPVRTLTDPLTGFFLFRRSLVAGVELQPIGWKISLEVLVRSRARKLAEVPYTFACRADGDSKASLNQGLLVLRHIAVLLMSLAGVQRFVRFGLVGLSGMGVNTGTVLALSALGFDALAWPIWVATELAILWNYAWNKRVTWSDRSYGSWWSYNLAALGSSLVAIASTSLLAGSGVLALWLASLVGILLGMGLNYVVLDRVVFTSLSRLGVQPPISLSQYQTTPDLQVQTSKAA